MSRILVFGGTCEGRELVSWLAGRGVSVIAYSATEYGESLLPESSRVLSFAKRLDAEQMVQVMRQEAFSCVVDATHPYAVEVSANIKAAASELGLEVMRLVREDVPEGPWTSVASTDEAARLIARRKGNVLLTTGSKDLAAYVQAVPDYKQRLYVRILPVASSLEQADKLGIPASRIIAMQGPFSAELNKALIESLEIETLVTKAAGKAGGFPEKVQAARETGCELLVIDRPVENNQGISLDEAKCLLAQRFC